MKNKKLLVVAIAVIGVGLVLVLSFINRKKVQNQQNTSVQTQKSLKDLLTQGVPQKCTYKINVDDQVSEGEVYVSDKKYRGDFSSTTDKTMMKTHVISDGAVSYFWTDGEKNGFKMKVEDSVEDNEGSGEDAGANFAEGSVNIENKYDYDCSAWIVSESMFTPPSEVKFMDMSEMFAPQTSSVPSTNTTGDSSQCSLCDSLSGSDKTTCLSSLGCN